MEKATSFAFVFTIIYVLFVGLVMFNIVIAILSESFDSVKHRTRTLDPLTDRYTIPPSKHRTHAVSFQAVPAAYVGPARRRS
jgi:hypothetical protein